MTEKLMETACARLCLLTHIAWDSRLPPPLSRPAVHRLIESGALSGLVLRETPSISKATYDRAQMLLTRAKNASLEIKNYEKRGYRLLLPEEKHWPTALHKLGNQEPLFLFTKGTREILNRKKVAVAGSRKIEYRTAGVAARLGEKMAAEKLAMVCGGASGVDQIAQDALLDAGGVLILIPAVEADQICRRKREAEALKKRRLLLVCETLPDAPFSAQKALMRNHTIYAMGRAAIVVASRKNMGGSWHGATDCLRDGFSPVYAIDETGRDYEGNHALITEHHAKPFDLEKSMRRQLGIKDRERRRMLCK